MNTHNWLRLIHIVIGVFWVGTAVFVAALSDGAYALAAGQIGRKLTAARIRLVTRLSGGMLIGGGLWLAFSRAR